MILQYKSNNNTIEDYIINQVRETSITNLITLQQLLFTLYSYSCKHENCIKILFNNTIVNS